MRNAIQVVQNIQNQGEKFINRPPSSMVNPQVRFFSKRWKINH